MRNDKFLENTGNAAFGNSDQRGPYQQTRTAIAGRIVRVGEPGRGKAADNCRVIRLPLLVVSLADHRIAERVEKSLLRSCPCLCRSSVDPASAAMAESRCR